MKIHLEKIDFLRGIAILLVFVYHVSVVVIGPGYELKEYRNFFIDFDKYSTNEIVQNLMPYAYGWSGVELFLIISGFLIHSAYLREQKLNSFLFFNKRFWRIWPPYFIALVFFSIALHHGWTDFFVHAFLLHNLHQETFYSINSSFWSLALEAQLYLIYPLFLYFRNRVGLKTTVIGIFTLQLLAAIFEYVFTIESLPYHYSILKFWIIWVMGAYLAEKYNKGERIVNAKAVYLALFLVFIMLLRLTILFKYFRHVFFSIFFMLLLDMVLHSQKDKWYRGRIFSFFVTLGLCSYSLYLFHQPYLSSFIRRLWIVDNAFFGFLAILVTFLILFAVSYANYKIVELPSINFGKKAYKYLQNRTIKMSFTKRPS